MANNLAQPNLHGQSYRPQPEPPSPAKFNQGQRQLQPAGPRDKFQSHIVAASGEFLGTFMFLWMAYTGHLMIGGQAVFAAHNEGPSNSTVIYISLNYGFALLVNVWAFFRISGGMFNPAVTLGLCLSGGVPWLRGAVVVPMQLLGAVFAGLVVKALNPYDVSSVNTSLAPGVSPVQGFVFEVILTAQLVFVILMLAVEKHKASFMAPLGIGLALFVAQIAGVYFTGGSLNPARSLGCAVAAHSFPQNHWIYWVAPCVGAAVAAGYYRLLKLLHYEKANPGQDGAKGAFLDADDAA